MLAEAKTPAQRRRQKSERVWNDLAEHARALAAAGNDELDRALRCRNAIGKRALCNDRRTHRVAGLDRPEPVGRTQPRGRGKAEGDTAGPGGGEGDWAAAETGLLPGRTRGTPA